MITKWLRTSTSTVARACFQPVIVHRYRNTATNYCERVAEGETRNCQELAAAENYKAKIAGDKAIPIYNKYYKRYAARVRVKQIREADFKKWKYQAITLRNECSAGKITVEEYIQWMEDSFPNRKPKA